MADGVEDGLYMPDMSYLLYKELGEDEDMGLLEYGDWLYMLLPSYPWYPFGM